MNDETDGWSDASWRPLLYVMNVELEGKHENNSQRKKWGRKKKVSGDESE
jgi:hypothetical protein